MILESTFFNVSVDIPIFLDIIWDMDEQRKRSRVSAFELLMLGVLSVGCVTGIGIQSALDSRWGIKHRLCAARLADITDILSCTFSPDRLPPPPLPPRAFPLPTVVPRNAVRS